MKIFKTRKENPETTAKGDKITLAITVISLVATLVGVNHPELKEIIDDHIYEIATVLVSVAGSVWVYFSNKKDE